MDFERQASNRSSGQALGRLSETALCDAVLFARCCARVRPLIRLLHLRMHLIEIFLGFQSAGSGLSHRQVSGAACSDRDSPLSGVVPDTRRCEARGGNGYCQFGHPSRRGHAGGICRAVVRHVRIRYQQRTHLCGS